MIDARSISDIWRDEVYIPGNTRWATGWAIEAIITFDKGEILSSTRKWLVGLGYEWPMTEEQEVEFKLKYM